MIQGIYSSASALTAATQQQEALAQNLAHATVPGYRRRALAFSSFEQALAGTATGTGASATGGAQVAREYSAFQPGDYQATNNPLDLAIRGDGFFVLQGPNGPVYTRSGVFQMDGQGRLQSASGLLLDSGGGAAITIPPGSSRITIAQDGTVTAGTTQLGQIQLVSFSDPSQLARVGPTLFEAPPGSAPQPSQSSLLQGFREGSNVNIVQEMVSLIAGTRYYEAATRALSTLSNALQQRTTNQQI